MKNWSIEYLPGDNACNDRLFTGTREEVDAYFLNEVVCEHCRDEVVTGECKLYNFDGSYYDTVPGSKSPWSTGCGCEWDLYEILEDGTKKYAFEIVEPVAMEEHDDDSR